MSEISALAVRARELLAYDPGTGEFRWCKSDELAAKAEKAIRQALGWSVE